MSEFQERYEIQSNPNLSQRTTDRPTTSSNINRNGQYMFRLLERYEQYLTHIYEEIVNICLIQSQCIFARYIFFIAALKSLKKCVGILILLVIHVVHDSFSRLLINITLVYKISMHLQVNNIKIDSKSALRLLGLNINASFTFHFMTLLLWSARVTSFYLSTIHILPVKEQLHSLDVLLISGLLEELLERQERFFLLEPFH